MTSGLHLKRSLLYFSHFGMGCLGAPADEWQPRRSWLPLAYNLALTDFAIHEHVGILRFKVYNALGWNVKVPEGPGAA